MRTRWRILPRRMRLEACAAEPALASLHIARARTSRHRALTRNAQATLTLWPRRRITPSAQSALGARSSSFISKSLRRYVVLRSLRFVEESIKLRSCTVTLRSYDNSTLFCCIQFAIRRLTLLQEIIVIFSTILGHSQSPYFVD